MLSQTSEYALRAMVCLADSAVKDKEHYVNVPDMALSTKVPITYLSKVLQALTRGKLVQQKRGIKGGFRLAKAPEEIALLSIVQLFDEIERIRSCPLKLKEHSRTLCPLHSTLDKAACALISSFSTTTLKDLISQKGPVLCQ